MAGFANRVQAGQALAKRLGRLDPDKTVVLALPRGGVPVAAEIARPSGVPLDLLIVRKIGAPGHEELAAGAIVDGDDPQIVINDSVARQFGLSADDIHAMSADDLQEIERRRQLYLGGRVPLSVKGKTAIVVDDGIATGASIKAALNALAQRSPDRVVLAIPVAPAEVLADLSDYAEEIICLETPYPFYAVGAHYRNFPQVDDAAVMKAMQAANLRMQSKTSEGKNDV